MTISSRDDESQGESNSIINQKAFLEDYAKRNSFTNIRHFTDDGVSGTTFDRKGFQAMIAEVEAGTIATIIVKDMSRFGRDYLKVGLYTDVLFKDKGVRFIAINNGIDSDKQGDNDFTPFLNIMNASVIISITSKKLATMRFSLVMLILIPSAKWRKGKVSAEIVAAEAGESYKQLQRYIRLTELLPDLLEQGWLMEAMTRLDIDGMLQMFDINGGLAVWV